MERYKQFAMNLAKEAGGIMRADFMLGMKKEWKEDNSPVTETDLKINQLVIDSVQKEFPDHSILSEEGSVLKTGSQYTWVCDPVDGTTDFSHGIPISIFSLALVKDGKSILGVTYDPFMDRLYYAQEGRGAYLNESRIYVTKQKELRHGCIDIYIPTKLLGAFPTLTNDIQAQGVKKFSLHTTVTAGSLVAAGQFLAVCYFAQHAHDVAALKILVEEAGGKVTDVDGNEQRYDQSINGAIISNGHVHEQLLELVKRNRAQ